MDQVKAFFDAWEITDDAARAKSVSGILTDDVTYVDPMTEAPLSGKEAVTAYIGNFAKMAPGGRAEAIDPIDDKGGFARATVRFVMGDKAQTGQYFIAHAEGRLTHIVGFVGKGPE